MISFRLLAQVFVRAIGYFSLFRENILRLYAGHGIISMTSRTNGDSAMQVSYDKLWKLLIDKKMNRSDLKRLAGISFNVLAKMGKNEFISMESLCKICDALSCNISDVVDFVTSTETNANKP